jgi:hypothetical protein
VFAVSLIIVAGIIVFFNSFLNFIGSDWFGIIPYSCIALYLLFSVAFVGLFQYSYCGSKTLMGKLACMFSLVFFLLSSTYFGLSLWIGNDATSSFRYFGHMSLHQTAVNDNLVRGPILIALVSLLFYFIRKRQIKYIENVEAVPVFSKRQNSLRIAVCSGVLFVFVLLTSLVFVQKKAFFLEGWSLILLSFYIKQVLMFFFLSLDGGGKKRLVLFSVLAFITVVFITTVLTGSIYLGESSFGWPEYGIFALTPPIFCLASFVCFLVTVFSKSKKTAAV